MQKKGKTKEKRLKEKSMSLKNFVQFLGANVYIQIHSNDWKFSWHDKKNFPGIQILTKCEKKDYI